MKQNSIFIVLLMIAGCAASLPIPTEGDGASRTFRGQTVTTEELQSDREAYIRRCSGCHGLYLPSAYTRQQWDEFLGPMILKSKATADESLRIERFVHAYTAPDSTK